MTVAKLYYIPNIQHLVYQDNPSLEKENLNMNRFDTLIYRGGTNTIDFSIRDKDRTPIKLLDKTLTVTINNIETKDNVLVKQLEILDADKGFARLTLTSADTNEWATGFYSYSVNITEANGREGFAFVDQVYRVTGEFELRGDAVFGGDKIVTIPGGDEGFTFVNGTEPYYLSSAIRFGTGTVHTAAWYLEAFMGVIEMQATLDSSTSFTDNDWTTEAIFDTDDLTPGPLSCIKYMNITGNYTFVRFKYTPHGLNTGDITQVLYICK